jgi:hypothetical protein
MISLNRVGFMSIPYLVMDSAHFGRGPGAQVNRKALPCWDSNTRVYNQHFLAGVFWSSGEFCPENSP